MAMAGCSNEKRNEIALYAMKKVETMGPVKVAHSSVTVPPVVFMMDVGER